MLKAARNWSKKNNQTDAHVFNRKQVSSPCKPDSMTSLEEGNVPTAVTVEVNSGASELSAKHKGPRFVILHYSPFKVVWDWITLLLVIYTAVFTPFAVAFLMNEDTRRNQLNEQPISRLRNADYNQADPFVMIDLIVDIMFIIDIIINFRTTFLSNGDVITDPLKIAVSYVKGWFLIDAMAAVPLDLLLFGTGTSDTVTIMGVLKVARLLRLLRVLRRLDQYAQYGAAMLLIMMGVFTLVAHWLACGWYFIAHIEKARSDRPIGWLDSLATAYQMPFLKNDSMSGPDIRSRYITALYFTLTTITSIGFGNVAAFTNGEKLFAIFAMMVGSLITAAIFGNVSSIMLRMYSGAEEYHEMQQSIKEFIKFHNIPKQLAKRLSDSYQQSWNITNGVDMNSVLKGFPDCLQADICLHLNRNLLTNCPAFHGASPGCLRSLSLKFKTTLAPAFDTLIHPGDIIDCVYFIARGSIEIVKDDSVMAILGKNDIFGENITTQRLQQTCAEMQGMEFEKKVTKSNYYVRALTYCDMCKILTSDLEDVLDVYPEFANNFLSSFHVSFDLERGEYATQAMNKKLDSATARFIRQKRPRLQSRSSADLPHKLGRESEDTHTLKEEDCAISDATPGVHTRLNAADTARRIQTFESNLYTTVDAILDILGHKPLISTDKSPSSPD